MAAAVQLPARGVIDIVRLYAFSFLTLVFSTSILAASCSDASPPPSGSSGITSSSSGTTSGAPAEGGGATDGAVDAPLGPELCNGVEQLSQTHQEIQQPDAPPVPKGGAIVPGTYVYNALDAFESTVDGGSDPPPPGPTGRIGRSTLYVTATTMRFTTSEAMEPAALPADTVVAFTYKVNGTSLDLTSVCPNSGTRSTIPYSVEDRTLSFFVGQKRRATYLRKP